ncbi:MAG: RNA pseudouridine synthase [Spirochaetaceae bacterium]|jgi:23S rRNA pseudouridine1911/1915/1917 synthase|nr:RNA pseudouridine synthase [Spirochaetaceae bacterium]
MGKPSVVDETIEYAVLFKPHRVHTVPLKGRTGGHEPNLLDWYGRLFPKALTVCGRHPWEGGVLHRLDYETQGLVLVAKTQRAMQVLITQQEEGRIIKEYRALTTKRADPLPGFPPSPRNGVEASYIASGFRPYGPGRKAVRPVLFPAGKPQKICTLDRGNPYITEVLRKESTSIGDTAFRLRLIRGFRHQIRCHLAWIGYPIVNDALYGGVIRDTPPAGELPEFPVLALVAEGIRFFDPRTGDPRRYTLETG